MIFIKGNPESREAEAQICELAFAYIKAVDAGDNGEISGAKNAFEYFLNDLEAKGIGHYCVEVSASIMNAREYYNSMTREAVNKHIAQVAKAKAEKARCDTLGHLVITNSPKCAACGAMI